MRFSTIASTALLAFSPAAFAAVTPVKNVDVVAKRTDSSCSSGSGLLSGLLGGLGSVTGGLDITGELTSAISGLTGGSSSE